MTQAEPPRHNSEAVADGVTVEQTPAGVATGSAGSSAASDTPPHSSRHRKSRNARSLERERRITRNLKIVVAVMLVAATAIVVVGSKTQNHLVDQNDKLQVALKKVRVQLKKAEALNGELRTQIESLVDGRLPGLNGMAYDEVIPLNQDYVKNVILGLSRDEGYTAYEYRFALLNRDSLPVVPNFSMYLFDEQGIQVGNADVTRTGRGTEGLSRALAPGEVRSYSGSAELIPGREPKFFMLNLQ